MDTVINVIGIGVILYALIAAANAAKRVRQKRQMLDRSSSLQPSDRPVPQTAAPATPPVEPSEQNLPPTATTALRISPEIPSEPEGDLSLAVSLPVSELVNPGQTDLPRQNPTSVEPAIPAVEAKDENAPSEPHAHSPTVLEEIAQLGRTTPEDAISYFSKYLDHSDSAIRGAAVFELGELAANRQGAEAERIVKRLIQLNQDEDAQVRLQVVAAMEKIQSHHSI
jgi:HEAT repeats